jgi:hypothetical protein
MSASTLAMAVVLVAVLAIAIVLFVALWPIVQSVRDIATVLPR